MFFVKYNNNTYVFSDYLTYIYNIIIIYKFLEIEFFKLIYKQ